MLSLSHARVMSREEKRASKTSKIDAASPTTIALTRKSRGLSMVAGPGVNLIGGKVSYMSHWLNILRRFNDANKDTCRALEEEMDEPYCIIEFPTGSSYKGPWNVRGMTGHGTYHFPDSSTRGGGVYYEGNFEEGQCHGEGQLHYDVGCTVRATWSRGLVTERRFFFDDGLEYYEEGWNYCILPDRRYTKEYEEGLEPAGLTIKTAPQPTKEIPPGYYDVGDGFYNVITQAVVKYNDITAIVRYPCKEEQKWILRNCRTNPLRGVGSCPFFYEIWRLPTLRLEEPPPPAAETLRITDTAADEFFDEDEAYHWHHMRFSRASRLSRVSRSSRASHASHGAKTASHLSLPYSQHGSTASTPSYGSLFFDPEKFFAPAQHRSRAKSIAIME